VSIFDTPLAASPQAWIEGIPEGIPKTIPHKHEEEDRNPETVTVPGDKCGAGPPLDPGPRHVDVAAQRAGRGRRSSLLARPSQL